MAFIKTVCVRFGFLHTLHLCEWKTMTLLAKLWSLTDKCQRLKSIVTKHNLCKTSLGEPTVMLWTERGYPTVCWQSPSAQRFAYPEVDKQRSEKEAWMLSYICPCIEPSIDFKLFNLITSQVRRCLTHRHKLILLKVDISIMRAAQGSRGNGCHWSYIYEVVLIKCIKNASKLLFFRGR